MIGCSGLYAFLITLYIIFVEVRMSRLKGPFVKYGVLGAIGAAALSSPAHAASVATFDFASASDTITAAGVAILSVAAIVFAFRLARRFVGV